MVEPHVPESIREFVFEVERGSETALFNQLGFDAAP